MFPGLFYVSRPYPYVENFYIPSEMVKNEGKRINALCVRYGNCLSLTDITEFQ